VEGAAGPSQAVRSKLVAVRTAVALVILLAWRLAGAAPEPAEPGPFAVGVATLALVDPARDRTLVTEVWYPDGASRRRRFPLVLVAHGNCGFRTNYEHLTVSLASHGFVVAAPDFPGFNAAACDVGGGTGLFGPPARDLAFVAGALTDAGGPAAAVAARVRRPGRIGLVGHSLGAHAVATAAIADRRFTTIVALAPLADALLGARLAAASPRRAVLVAVGTADTTLPPATTAEPFFAALSAPAYLVAVAGGTHSGFTDQDAALGAAGLVRQQTLVRRYAIAFLARFLAGKRAFGSVLSARDARAQGEDVSLTVRR
jgi:predicted dienelactone hydrolase